MRPGMIQNPDMGQTWWREDKRDSFDTKLASDLSCSSIS